MVFSSLTFIFIFLSATFLLYALPFGLRYKNAVLLLASLVFYAWGEPVLFLLLIDITLIAYLGAFIIDHHWFIHPKRCTLWTVIISLMILSNLLAFKYAGFVVENLQSFGFSISIGNVKLPIGISFYTFQVLSYVLDLRRGKVALQKNIFRLLLYVSFFPQLIAGPIVRYSTIEEELEHRKSSLEDVSAGARRFITGLAKKVIIANGIAGFVELIYAKHLDPYGTAMYWIAAFAYTLQIYYDFSGYSDMAIGLGRIFGFHFLENFNYPYCARSVSDFWRRWHISLSTWFRDYVYIPLGGSKHGGLRHLFNLLIVWLLTGFWHGASWNFALWGLYYFAILWFEKFVIEESINRIPHLFTWIFTMFIVIVGWVVFYFTDFNLMLETLTRMFTITPTNWVEIYMSNTSILQYAVYILLGLFGMFPLGRAFSKIEKNAAGLAVSNLWHIAIFVVCVAVILSGSYNPFIYFRF